MLLFLDIDGVLVPASSWKAPTLLDDGFPVFSKKATAVLRTLLGYEPTIILTTSHRNRYSITQWREIFDRRGVKIDKLATLSVSSSKKRSEEIIEWFESNHVNDGFVIIDDDTSLHGLPPHLKQHLVSTSPLVGLIPEHLPQIDAILGKPVPVH